MTFSHIVHDTKKAEQLTIKSW